MARVLVVEDDVPLAELLRDQLGHAGHHVSVAETGTAGLALALASRPELIVLDLMLPGVSGFEVCRRLREATTLPQPIVLILTARTSEEDLVLGYDVGADDFVRKPFSIREVNARVNALLRLRDRREPARAARHLGKLVLAPAERSACVEGAPLVLTPLEFDLLYYLAERAPEVVSRDQLLLDVWGYSHNGYARTVDTHVTRLRRKLSVAGVDARMLRTVHGVGYAFEPEPSEA
jgi:DNA-binding response OmpR family regulator